ncbi:hypothetical protein MMC07_009871 [Pseudocyphellaria aurata]|nr:hypothetical protein [Pseudocyphellaria aurata]
MACKECLSGALHEGTPVGREETIHGLPTYVSEPPAGQVTGIIVVIPDGLGWTFNNSRILADTYAKRTNARVYLPDFMDGCALPVGVIAQMDTVTDQGWMIGKILPMMQLVSAMIPFTFFTRLSVTQPRVYRFFRDLQDQNATLLPVGAAGFCWGGKFVFLLCNSLEKAANGRNLIDCGFTAHPSNLVNPADANAVTSPLSVIVGDKDMIMSLKEAEQVKGILQSKGKDTHEMVIVPGATHGFATRARPNDNVAVQQGMQATEQAVRWFKKWLVKSSL